MKLCPFCQTPIMSTNRTKEHILQQTYLNRLGVRKVTIQHSNMQSIDDGWNGLNLTPPKEYRAMDYGSFVLGAVCNKCNNGWMGTVGEKFCNLVIKNRKRPIQEWTKQKRKKELISHWLMMTASSLQLLNKVPNFGIPTEHIHGIELKNFPKNLVVCAHNLDHEISGMRFAFGSTWPIETPDYAKDFMFDGWRNYYKIYIQILSFGFVIGYFPANGVNFILPSDTTILSANSRYRVVKSAPDDIPEIDKFYLSIGVEFR